VHAFSGGLPGGSRARRSAGRRAYEMAGDQGACMHSAGACLAEVEHEEALAEERMRWREIKERACIQRGLAWRK